MASNANPLCNSVRYYTKNPFTLACQLLQRDFTLDCHLIIIFCNILKKNPIRWVPFEISPDGRNWDFRELKMKFQSVICTDLSTQYCFGSAINTCTHLLCFPEVFWLKSDIYIHYRNVSIRYTKYRCRCVSFRHGSIVSLLQIKWGMSTCHSMSIFIKPYFLETWNVRLCWSQWLSAKDDFKICFFFRTGANKQFIHGRNMNNWTWKMNMNLKTKCESTRKFLAM